MIANVIWITGLSGSGKTTLANVIVDILKKSGIFVVMLDGDELRKIFNGIEKIEQSYDKKARLVLAFKYSYLCKMLVSQEITVVIATISLFKEIHLWNRENLSGYFEVYLKVPIEELRRRDTKGIYSDFDLGKISNVAGYDLLIDEPHMPDLIIKFDKNISIINTAYILLDKLKKIYEM